MDIHMMRALFLGLVLAAHPALPHPATTPGLTRGLSTATICATRWGADARAVTEAMKNHVASAYGLQRSAIVAYGQGPCCEFDHLISRELGGADDVRNLWPQPWKDAKRKDQLENRLHVLVCAGMLDLSAAQQAIATDWVGAYARYVCGGHELTMSQAKACRSLR
jgi:hypothetical protein